MNPSPAPAAVDLDDVQGLLRFGYKRQTQACFVMLRVKNRSAARQWLAEAPVTSATTTEPPPTTALQIAFTSMGLRALGVPDDVVAGFSAEFIAGMGTDASRARRLGDVGANDPSHWRWGTGRQLPDVLLLLYAVPGALADWKQTILAACDEGFEPVTSLATSDMDGIEPFGFTDGISQPELDWKREREVRDADRLAYGNLACLGEFVLGYPNEYGRYTDRPLLDPARDVTRQLARAEDAPDKSDLGRNGSYLVLRQLQQDVRGFWQFIDRCAEGDPARREQLAAAMVGRRRDGTPLVETDAASADGASNAFTYQGDPAGLRCPVGAHIRRSNPRNADLPSGASTSLVARLARMLGFASGALREDLIASTRFHRLLRRGREYGSGLGLEQALQGAAPADETGLHFICLGANIARQFEFVQGAWLMAPKFAGLANESDPLLGHRRPGLDGAATDSFSMPQAAGPDQRVAGLPQFVTVLGGAYFFLPGIRALRVLATVR